MKKQNRLKKNEEIANIVKQKKKVNSFNFIIYYSFPKYPYTRVALSVSKKFGNAVQRNYIKRKLREVIRPNIEKYSAMDFVIVIKPGIEEITFLELEKEMDFCMALIEKKLNKGDKNETKKN